MSAQYIYNTDFYQAINKNKRNSTFLLLGLFLILAVLGYLVGNYVELTTNNHYTSNYNNYEYYYSNGYYYPKIKTSSHATSFVSSYQISQTGVTFAAVAVLVGAFWSLIAIFAGPQILLSSANARQITTNDKDYLTLINVVEEVAIAAGAPLPKIYVIETDELNAFATGMSPKKGIVAVTRGLLNKLSRDELQGVMAHEMGHVINYDIRYQTLVSIIVGLIVLISDIAMRMAFHSNRSSSRNNSRNNNNGAAIIGLILIVFTIIAPIAAVILQLAVSRQREYMADATSVKLTRNPEGLINALYKLAENAKPFPGASKANQNLWIVNPFKNVANIKNKMFATHPPLEDRINRLKDLSK